MKKYILGLLIVGIFLVGLVSGGLLAGGAITTKEKADLEINLDEQEQTKLGTAGIDPNKINITFIACNRDACKFMLIQEKISYDITVPANGKTDAEILKAVQASAEHYLKETAAQIADTPDTERFASGKVTVKAKEKEEKA